MKLAEHLIQKIVKFLVCFDLCNERQVPLAGIVPVAADKRRVEKLFLHSMNEAIATDRDLLSAELTGGPQLVNDNLDVGRQTAFGMYPISDKAYAELLDKLADRHFADVSRALQTNILNFYKDLSPLAAEKPNKKSAKLMEQITTLKNVAAEPAN